MSNADTKPVALLKNLRSSTIDNAERPLIGTLLTAYSVKWEEVDKIRSKIEPSELLDTFAKHTLTTIYELSERHDRDSIDINLLVNEVVKRNHVEVDSEALHKVISYEIKNSYDGARQGYIDTIKKSPLYEKIYKLQDLIPTLTGDDLSNAVQRLGEAISAPKTGKRKPHIEITEESMADLYLSECEETPTLFADALPVGDVAILTAQGGTGKSTLTIQMGMALALGEGVLSNCNNRLIANKRTGVLIVGFEDSVKTYKTRLQSIMKSRRYNSEQVSELMTKLAITSVEGKNLTLTEQHKGSYRISEATDELIEDIKAMGRQFGLIIVDPLARMFGGNENDNIAATVFINALTRIAKETGAAVLVVHHSGKGNPTNARGSSGFTDGARTHISMASLSAIKRAESKTYRPTEADKNIIVLSMLKSNHTKPWHSDIYLCRGEGYELRQCDSETWDGISAENQRNKREQEKAITQFIRSNDGVYSANQLETSKDIRDQVISGEPELGDIGRNQMRGAIFSLIEKGAIFRDGKGKLSTRTDTEE